MGLGFESEVVSSWQIQNAGFRSSPPVAFRKIKTILDAKEMLQVSMLKETFPESYYLENKMLLWPSVHFPCVNSSVLTAR